MHDPRSPHAEPPDNDEPTLVTRLLIEWRDGDAAALERLMPVVYDELRRVAQRHMQRETDSTLQATALVNEAYLRLVGIEVDWKDRVHFFAVAAGLMRRILVDRARRRRADKRGGGGPMVVLDDMPGTARPEDDLLALDQALEQLAEQDPRKSRVLELRFFGGLTIEETAAVLELSHATVERDLKTARAWILQRLRSAGDSVG